MTQSDYEIDSFIVPIFSLDDHDDCKRCSKKSDQPTGSASR